MLKFGSSSQFSGSDEFAVLVEVEIDLDDAFFRLGEICASSCETSAKDAGKEEKARVLVGPRQT